MIKKILAILSVALFLTGCGETFYVHNAKGESEFYNDKNVCIREANMTYPVMKSQPAYTGSTTNCYGFGYSVNCTTTPNPNYLSNVDWNASSRDSYVNECLKSKGWRVQETTKNDDPISSFLDDLF